MEITEQFQQEIAPFYWVDGGGGASVCLDTGLGFLQAVFDRRAAEGFLGNGYDWESLARVFLDEERPDLRDKLDFDPEAGMFCVYSEDRDALAGFIRAFRQACGDEARISDLFRRAELD